MLCSNHSRATSVPLAGMTLEQQFLYCHPALLRRYAGASRRIRRKRSHMRAAIVCSTVAALCALAGCSSQRRAEGRRQEASRARHPPAERLNRVAAVVVAPAAAGAPVEPPARAAPRARVAWSPPAARARAAHGGRKRQLGRFGRQTLGYGRLGWCGRPSFGRPRGHFGGRAARPVRAGPGQRGQTAVPEAREGRRRRTKVLATCLPAGARRRSAWRGR